MYSILIVEDEPLELDFLKAVASEEFGEEDIVLSCRDGKSAVALAKQYRPNMIIMDIMLPEMDGLSAIEAMREFLPHACISILTGHMDFDYAQKAVSLQTFEYLLKPIRPVEMKEVLMKMKCAADRVYGQTRLLTQETRIRENHVWSSIDKSIRYIQEHFKEKLTLETVAAEVFMSPQYFSRVFKKEMGVAFSRYVIDLKVQYACQLLEVTKLPAYRISLECGFSDPSYFNKVFGMQMDMTPQAYRKHAVGFDEKGEEIS